MADNLTLNINHVSKSFARIEKDDITNALADVDLHFHSKEFVSLVGTSGCGKSTILRLIAGLITPTSGSLDISGTPITKPGPDRGMVFQKPTLFPWLTVKKNVEFSLKMQNRLNGNEELMDRMLRLIHLEAFKDDYPGQLSGGMAQRVALVRSLISNPEILLMDEPLGALDAFTRMAMQDEILDIWQKSRQLVVMVTHDIDEAIYMGTKVVIMDANPGRIRAEIPIELTYPRNRSSSLFVEYRNQILEMMELGVKE